MVLIKRTQNPTLGKKYQFYKPFLRIDFEYRCSYCKNREVVEGGTKKFHIDHYKPQSKFPELINEYLNLFYCCSECNNAKKDFWPTILDHWMSRYILNPCIHDFEEHYNMKHPEWRGYTRVALWNIEKLKLNSKRRIQFRQDELDVCEIIAKLNSQQEELEKLIVNNILPEKSKESAEKDLNDIRKQIAIFKRKTFDPLE
jgi:HNH endonuclease